MEELDLLGIFFSKGYRSFSSLPLERSDRSTGRSPPGPSRDGVDDPDWRSISRLFFSSWRLQLWQGPRSIISTFRSALDESVEPTPFDELLDFISELNAFLHVMVVVMLIEVEFIWVALFGVRAHPFQPR